MGDCKTLLITIPFPPFEKSYDKLRRLHPNLKILHYETSSEDIVPREIWQMANYHLTLFLFPPDDRKQIPRLTWVHLYSGGVNQAIKEPLLQAPDIVWTRNSGVHAPQIAEWVIASLLSHFRQIPMLLELQKNKNWDARNHYLSRGDLLNKTMACLGYGAIARHSARIASACGMRVIVFTLHEKSTPHERRSATFTPHNTGDPDGRIPDEWHHGSLNDFLSLHIDVLLIALPSTDKTRKCIGKDQLSKLKNCYLINIARGDIVDTNALVEALNCGTLRGAALDATDPEPLPSGHPLWSASNTFISPHISGISDEYMPRTIEIMDENLKRLHAGEPLINQISPSEYY